MTDRVIVVTVRAAAAAGASLAVAGTVVSLVAGHLGYWWTSHVGVATLLTVGLCAVVWIVVGHQPRNASVWAMATAPLGGVIVLVSSLTPFLADAEPRALRYPHYVPSEHPASVAWLIGIAEALTNIGVFVPLTLALLLFPTGSLPDRRWRWAAWWAAASVAAVSVAYLVAGRPSAATTPEGEAVLGVAQFAVLAAMVLSVASVLARFHSSSGDTRQQIKWVLWGGAVAAVALGAGMATAGGDTEWLSPLVVFLGFAALITAYGVAMARYRLYDVDVVISRTIVFGSLAAIITGVYVAVVVGIGDALGGSSDPNTALAITTTAGVAAAFQPLRRRLQRIADRLVYGRRATPHEVLSELAQRVAANDDRLLEQVARSLVDGTGASHVAVQVNVDGRPVTTVGWPEPPPGGPAGTTARFSIEQHGAELGSLELTVPGGHHLSAPDRVLVEQVAAGMALALRNRALTQALEGRVAELRASRRRLVSVQDDTRRRLERDLHDGAQQQLVALRVKFGLAQAMADKHGSRATRAALERLAQETDQVVDAVRDFARGVYPPLLEAEGLGPAVAALARRSQVKVTADTAGIGRLDRDVESTVYACVVEALRNVDTHAGAHEAVVAITQDGDEVTFEVRDDGAGFDVVATPRGTGLTNVADRIDALAGVLALRSHPGAGTRVVGVIPTDGGRLA